MRTAAGTHADTNSDRYSNTNAYTHSDTETFPESTAAPDASAAALRLSKSFVPGRHSVQKQNPV